MQAKQSGSAVSIFTIVFVVLLTLKLAKVISLSWWWVFAPLWLPAAIIIVVSIVLFSAISLNKWLSSRR